MTFYVKRHFHLKVITFPAVIKNKVSLIKINRRKELLMVSFLKQISFKMHIIIILIILLTRSVN